MNSTSELRRNTQWSWSSFVSLRLYMPAAPNDQIITVKAQTSGWVVCVKPHPSDRTNLEIKMTICCRNVMPLISTTGRLENHLEVYLSHEKFILGSQMNPTVLTAKTMSPPVANQCLVTGFTAELQLLQRCYNCRQQRMNTYKHSTYKLNRVSKTGGKNASAAQWIFFF